MALLRGLGMVLADTVEVMDDKEKKDFNMETVKDELLAVKTLKTIWMSLTRLMCVAVIYLKFHKLIYNY